MKYILIAIILYGGLYLVLAYRNAKKLERQIKNKELPKELKDLDEEWNTYSLYLSSLALCL